MICDLYLFHFILNVASDGATIAGSASVFPVISAKTKFLDQVKINSISQLFNGIFKVLQKLLKYFSGMTTFAFVNESLFSGIFPVYLSCIYKIQNQ